jgi:hypothetical protein
MHIDKEIKNSEVKGKSLCPQQTVGALTGFFQMRCRDWTSLLIKYAEFPALVEFEHLSLAR